MPEVEVEDDVQNQWSIRHRPTKLKDFLGAERVQATVNKIISNKRSTSAVLITGESGIGKTTIAKIMAYDINGLKYGTRTTDIIDHNVGEKSGKDDMKALIEASRYLPSAKKKIFIIDEAHLLRGDAASVLLKPLEEPRQNVMWMLCTNEPEKLLTTIVNRCLPLPLQPPEPEELATYLMGILKKEKELTKDSDEDKLKLCMAVAEASGGTPRAAVGLLETAVDARDDYKSVKNLIKGPVLRTPTLELDKAAIKIILCLNKIYREKSMAALKPAVLSLENLNAFTVLNRLNDVLAAAVRSQVTGNTYGQAFMLFKTAQEAGHTLDPQALGTMFNRMVTAKVNMGDFRIDPATLLLDTMVQFAYNFAAANDDDAPKIKKGKKKKAA